MNKFHCKMWWSLSDGTRLCILVDDELKREILEAHSIAYVMLSLEN